MSSSKAELRQEALARLRLVTSEERQAWSEKIRDTLTSLPAWKEARCALIYAPLKNEPDLLPLLEIPRHSRPKLCFPRVHAGGMDFWEVNDRVHLVQGSTLLRGPEITQCQPVALDEIDLAVLPGLAFDPVRKLRLGRGGGYYDRLLADEKFHATSIGVCYSLQLQQGLPGEAHDMPMDLVLTEVSSGVYEGE